ncbi:MAG: sigma-70 family RNA polymerase sigma factor [Acidobacteria bacterium]|nr:sigma-70 family RNA polymerase sigma factor [Acidobacteriota bacterium]
MITNRNPEVRLKEFEAEAMPYINDLYRTASSILGNRTEAEDMIQELYLQAWKSFDRFKPGTNCRAWLHKILFHVISHRRRQWFGYRKDRFLEELETVEHTLTYEPPIPEELQDEEILDALRKIPEKFAAVLLLADVHEFSYKEIKETLGIPMGTVMSRLSRARKMLRAQLTKSTDSQNANVAATAA